MKALLGQQSVTYPVRHVSAGIAATGDAHARHDSSGAGCRGQEARRPGRRRSAAACQADGRADARSDGGRRQAACSVRTALSFPPVLHSSVIACSSKVVSKQCNHFCPDQQHGAAKILSRIMP